MIITTNGHENISIVHRDISITIEGHVQLIYEEHGLTVIVNSIPEFFFNCIPISDITSEIVIEC